MKQVLRRLAVGLSLIMLLALPRAALAQQNVFNEACQGVSGSTLCDENGRQTRANNNPIFGPNGITTKIARLIALIAGIAAVFMVIIGGIRYMIASGDPSGINGAKDSIIYALIGAAIAGFAQAIVSFVLVRL